MPKTKISEFSSTPANNTDIDSINIAENCPPSGINDAIRELMAQLKDWQSGTSNDPYVVGSSGSLTLNQGTANTVPYLNGSKVVTSGSALTFNGTNLGLGVTPSAWGGDYRVLQFASGSIAGYQTSALDLYGNAYDSGAGAWKYQNSSTGATRLASTNGQFQFYNAPVGTAGNAITFTQAMTLSAAGGLSVGTTSDAGAGNIRVPIGKSYTTYTADFGIGTPDSDGLQIFADSTNPIRFGNRSSGTFTERARIDSSGNLLVGVSGSIASGSNTTSGTQIAKTFLWVANEDASYFQRLNSDGTVQRFYRGANFIGSISVTTTGTVYNTTSDYRLKNITGALTGYKERLMSLQPKQGTWIANGSEFRGFLAHEFANPYRASVTGEKDAVDEAGNPVMQGMQASSSEVMADLVAMVKELVTENASLKARLDAANL